MIGMLRRLWMLLFGPKPLDVQEFLPADAKEDAPFDDLELDIPRNRREVYATYGNPGSAKLDRSWERAHMVVARELPIPRGKLYVHKLAEPCLRLALELCDEHTEYIDKIGCFNFRHMRHDESLPLSYHSWGIAVDINPADNRVKRYKRGNAPEPFSEEWYRARPFGVPRELVEAFEAAGWTWGGRWETFVDPMHFQLVG